jgi:valyl-tRNA synthetase
VYFENASIDERRRFEASASAICKLAGILDAHWLSPGEAPPQSAAAAIGSMSVHIPMAGLIDVGAELARIARRRDKLRQELKRATAKLGNESFIRNAPAEVVAQERDRVAGFERELAQLSEQHERVASLR